MQFCVYAYDRYFCVTHPAECEFLPLIKQAFYMYCCLSKSFHSYLLDGSEEKSGWKWNKNCILKLRKGYAASNLVIKGDKTLKSIIRGHKALYSILKVVLSRGTKLKIPAKITKIHSHWNFMCSFMCNLLHISSLILPMLFIFVYVRNLIATNPLHSSHSFTFSYCSPLTVDWYET